jgi:uncharacterized protein YdaT
MGRLRIWNGGKMPWTAESFRRKHNKKLSPKASAKAASIATAMVRAGVDEGIAIATANKRANAMERIVHRRSRQLRKLRKFGF